MIQKLISAAIRKPKWVMAITAIAVALSLVQFTKIKIDTDPENMLPAKAPVRIFDKQMKKEFSLYDFVVLGIVNDQNPNGVFNVATLTKIYELTNKIKDLDGVIAYELMAPSTKDNIEQDGIGAVKFKWLMDAPPKTEQEAIAIRAAAESHPMFAGTIVSEDGKMMALYIPIKDKTLSYEVAQKIRATTVQYKGEENYYITGLPVAEDQFGAEMFKQMAISAPLAGLVIFLLMWSFFKSILLIVAPMLVALATVAMTMGLMIGCGFPVHIMSSMIPIFLMPISVLDSVHILSEFFDKYQKFKDREKTIRFVMDELFSPMLFTSLTSAVGFFSLSFSPIPPVQVFGVYVAIGVMIAWVLTIVFVPAYVMLIKEKSLESFGRVAPQENEKHHLLDRFLLFTKTMGVKHYKAILMVTVLLIGVSIYGVTRIQVNDNPVRWFTAKHPIRVADRILNKHFAGTYQAYVVFESKDKEQEVFTKPEMLRYIETLQQALQNSGLVGKSLSLADMVKKIYYELLGGDKLNSVIPDSQPAIAQTLISFENSHKPDDLWHLVTPDYSKLNLWLQLRSGDNKDMSKVVQFTNAYIEKSPPPFALTYNWAGKTYINVVWQNNMVGGMLVNFLGSFVIVLFMMLVLFRSPVKALISMIPLTVTILFIYGLLGLIGKDYDMPVAVLSALTLGLSIDFAIHFIQRAIEIHDTNNDWEKTADEMFKGPGRAIVRNALVVAIGFLPLLAAPLVPYKTVGFFMFAIMAVSSVATLFIIPALISFKPVMIFEHHEKGMSCHCGQCVLVSVFVAVAVVYVLLGYSILSWPLTVFISIAVVAAGAAICFFSSKRKICLTQEGEK